MTRRPTHLRYSIRLGHCSKPSWVAGNIPLLKTNVISRAIANDDDLSEEENVVKVGVEDESKGATEVLW